MKCINMKVAVILFFMTNFISINSGSIKENRTSSILNEENSKNRFDEDCTDLVKMIRSNNLSDYIINCKIQSTKNHTLQEEVLQHACFVVQNMFNVMCKKKFSEKPLDLLGRNNANEICPFDFSHLKHLGLDSVFTDHELVKKLAQADDCRDICYLLYSSRPQCVLLSKFNDYFKTLSGIPQPDADITPVSPQVADITTYNTSGTAAASPPSQKQTLSNKSEAKNFVTKNREKTVVSQVPVIAPVETLTKIISKEKKAEKPVAAKQEVKSTEKAETPQEEVKQTEIDDEQISKNGDFSNEDNMQKMDDSLLEKTDLSQESYSPKMQNLEDKESPYLKDKSNFVAEGFPQAEDSHFFFYFIMMSSVVVVGYLAFHNKNKILAYALEGSSSRRNRRRPNPARYRKLETNLEEAISSSATNAATSSVVY